MIDEKVKRWVIKAMEDYKTIENEFKLSEEEIVPSAVCFHAQQFVEKILKAYLTLKGRDFGKTHNLEFLLRICSEEDKDFDKLNVGDLTFYAVDVRYPKELKMKFRWETEFKETDIGEIPKDWEVTNFGNRNYFEILSSGIERFEGLKEYLSTSSVNGNKIVEIEELITYDKRPSRANMQPVENSVWLARMINSPKFLKADKDLIKNKILSTGFLGVKTKTKETCDYLFYYIQTKEFQEYKDGYVTGAVQESLTNESAKEIIVVLPPISEQSRIANVLSWFDDLIENKERQNEILEKIAMAIFKSWFIDFEPFRDEEFVYNEELGKEIPKGWEVKRLGELVKTFKGISYKSSEKYQEYIEKGYIFITLDNFVRGGGFKNEYSWIKSERIKPSHLVKEGDLIIALTDMTQNAQVVGSPAIVILPKGFDVGVISLDCMKLEPVVENLKYYLYMFLKNTQEDNSTFANSVNVLHLMVNNFLNGRILFLPSSHIL